MGWRFRRSAKILPGVRLNFSKSGISTTLGPNGATLNVGKKGVTRTVGIPGTGISHSQLLSRASDDDGHETSPKQGGCGCGTISAFGLILFILATCFSPDPSSETAKPPAPLPNSQNSADLSPQTVIEQPANQQVQYVTANSVNGRAEPNALAARTQTLKRGDSVQIVEQKDGWTKVLQAGATFWVMSQYLHATPPPDRQVTTLKQGLSSARGYKQGKKASAFHRSGSCRCGADVCIGPRGGRYCITSGGHKRYGV